MKSKRCGACGSTLRAHKRGKARADNAKTDRLGRPRPAAGRRTSKQKAAAKRWPRLGIRGGLSISTKNLDAMADILYGPIGDPFKEGE